jgi:hypothetical protein
VNTWEGVGGFNSYKIQTPSVNMAPLVMIREDFTDSL